MTLSDAAGGAAQTHSDSRASLVDVFENALGHEIERLPDDVIASLSPAEADDLLDQFGRASRRLSA